MKNANQLANDSAQAFDNFKSVAANIAGVNGVIARLSVVANQNAALGMFSASVGLDGADDVSGNPFLFQQLLNELLSNQGFIVGFQFGVNATSVTIDWDPENQE